MHSPRFTTLTLCALLAAGCGTVDDPAPRPPGADPDGGVGDGASPPDAPLRRPGGVRFGDDVVDPGEAGFEGSNPFRDECPAGQAIVAMTGALGSIPGTTVVGKLQAHCGHPVVPLDGEPSVTTRSGKSLDEHGLSEDLGAWQRPCPEGQFVVGFAGRAGTRLDQLILHCAPLRLDAGAEQWAISRGLMMSLVAVGADTGAPFGAIDCPPGHVATGITGRVEQQMAGFGVLCREAIVEP